MTCSTRGNETLTFRLCERLDGNEAAFDFPVHHCHKKGHAELLT